MAVVVLLQARVWRCRQCGWEYAIADRDDPDRDAADEHARHYCPNGRRVNDSSRWLITEMERPKLLRVASESAFEIAAERLNPVQAILAHTERTPW